MRNKSSQVPQISNSVYGLGVNNQAFQKTKTIVEILICFLNKLHLPAKSFDDREFSCPAQSWGNTTLWLLFDRQQVISQPFTFRASCDNKSSQWHKGFAFNNMRVSYLEHLLYNQANTEKEFRE